MTARRMNGWQKSARNKAQYNDPPVIPTAWETLLHKLCVSEDQAATNRAIRAWVKENWTRRYVPEQVLDAVIPRELRV